MSLCFLGLLRFLMVVGGLQAFFSEHLVADKPCPPPGLQLLGGSELSHAGSDPTGPTAPGVDRPGPVFAATRTSTFPMRKVVAAPEVTYSVQMTQINQDKSSIHWPRQKIALGKDAICFVDKNDQLWTVVALLYGDRSRDYVNVSLLVKQVGEKGVPSSYIGQVRCKLGANNSTLLREVSGEGRLQVKVIVEEIRPFEIHPLFADAPKPAATPVAPGVLSAVPVPNCLTDSTSPPSGQPLALPVQDVVRLPVPTLGSNFSPTPMPKMVTLKIEDGKPKLAYTGGSDPAPEMTLDLPGGSVKLTASRDHIVIKGPDFVGRATKLEMVGDYLKLIGEAQMTCERIGPGAEVKAEALTVRLGSGGFAELVPCVRKVVPPLMPGPPGSVFPPVGCSQGECTKPNAQPLLPIGR